MFKYTVAAAAASLAILLPVALALPTDNQPSSHPREARSAQPSPHHGGCDAGHGGFAGAGAEAEAAANAMGGFGGWPNYGGGAPMVGAGAQASASSGSQAMGKK